MRPGASRHRQKPPPPRPRSLLPPDEAAYGGSGGLLRSFSSPKSKSPPKIHPQIDPLVQIRSAVLLCRPARPPSRSAKLSRALPRTPRCSPNVRLVRRPAAACGPWAPCSAARIPFGVALLCYARSMLLLPLACADVLLCCGAGARSRPCSWPTTSLRTSAQMLSLPCCLWATPKHGSMDVGFRFCCVGLLVLGEEGGEGPLIWGDVFFCPHCLWTRHNFAPGRSAIRCCAAGELFYF